MNKKNAGRKKIHCTLGEKSTHSICCYLWEWQQIKIFYEKLKKQRPKYYISQDDK